MENYIVCYVLFSACIPFHFIGIHTHIHHISIKKEKERNIQQDKEENIQNGGEFIAGILFIKYMSLQFLSTVKFLYTYALSVRKRKNEREKNEKIV